MRALVFHGVGDIRLDKVPDPKIEKNTDAIVRITTAAICGSDLHMVRGTNPGMKPGTILGHEGVGIVEDLGSEVRDFSVGDRVVISCYIACGYCSYCREGYYSMCDNSNRTVPGAGATYFGGTMATGSYNGLQAEKARIPFAATTMVKLPDAISDDQGVLLSDILPTAYFGCEMADIKPGKTVAIFGCGPVGLLSVMCAKQLFGASRVFAVDSIQSRLEMAQNLGAEIINFDKEDPVRVIRELTGGIGVDRAIDAVGIDAEPPEHGPAAKFAKADRADYKEEVREAAPIQHPHGELWKPGQAPTQAAKWAIHSLCKVGTLSIIGVYGPTLEHFPIGVAFNKNLTIRMGHCPQRKYIPMLIDMVRTGAIHPEVIISQSTPLDSVVDAYKMFDTRQPGWIKVELETQKHLAGTRR